MQPRRRFSCGQLLNSEVGSNLSCLGLHLGDSNWMSIGPHSWLRHPCWTHFPSHAPIVVICMCHVFIIPLIDEKPSTVSIVLETDPAQNKEERGLWKINGSKIIMGRDVTIFPMVKWIIAHRNLSKHVSSLIGRHTMFDNAILQKINTNKRQSRNRWLYIYIYLLEYVHCKQKQHQQAYVSTSNAPLLESKLV